MDPLGAVMIALGAGIYRHNGIARVLGVTFAVALLADAAVVIASAIVLYAVASTANWVQLMGWDR